MYTSIFLDWSKYENIIKGLIIEFMLCCGTKLSQAESLVPQHNMNSIIKPYYNIPHNLHTYLFSHFKSISICHILTTKRLAICLSFLHFLSMLCVFPPFKATLANQRQVSLPGHAPLPNKAKISTMASDGSPIWATGVQKLKEVRLPYLHHLTII